MAKTHTPLLSIAAIGSLSQALTYQKHRDHTTIRRRTTPTQPHSPAQLAQNTRVLNSVTAYQRFWALPTNREPWRLLTSSLSNRMSPYSKIQQALITAQRVFSNPTFALTATPYYLNRAKLTLAPYAGSGALTETGTAEIWAGTDPRVLSYKGSIDLATTPAITQTLGTAGQLVYIRVVKNKISRSGLLSCTLFELPANRFANPGFDTDSIWIKTEGWIIPGGYALWSWPGTSVKTLQQTAVAVIGRTYLIRITMLADTGGAMLYPYVGNKTGPGQYTAGTYDYIATPTASTWAGYIASKYLTSTMCKIDNAGLYDIT